MAGFGGGGLQVGLMGVQENTMTVSHHVTASVSWGGTKLCLGPLSVVGSQVAEGHQLLALWPHSDPTAHGAGGTSGWERLPLLQQLSCPPPPPPPQPQQGARGSGMVGLWLTLISRGPCWLCPHLCCWGGQGGSSVGGWVKQLLAP